MSELTASDWKIVEGVTAPAKEPKSDWPLMGDILTHRAGIPEHLIQWRRAEGNADLAPDD